MERYRIRLYNASDALVATLLDTWADPCLRETIVVALTTQTQRRVHLQNRFRAPSVPRGRGGMVHSLSITLDVRRADNIAALRAALQANPIPDFTQLRIEVWDGLSAQAQRFTYPAAALPQEQVTPAARATLHTYQFLVGEAAETSFTP